MTGIDDSLKTIGQVSSNIGVWSLLRMAADNATSILLPIIVAIAALLVLDLADKKINRKAFRAAAVISALALAGAVVRIPFLPGSIAISYLTLALVMTAVVFILGFVKLTALDYGVMFACFTCVNRFVGLNTWLFGSALPVFCVFFVVFAIYRIRLGRLGGQLFHAWFASILTVMEAYIYNTAFNKYIIRIGQVLDSNIKKVFVWGVAALAIIAINIAFIYAVKRLFGKRFAEINDMGGAYPRVERYFIYNSAAILLLAMLLNFAYGLANRFVNMPTLLFNLFLIFAQVIQFSFLILVFRITRLKDHLQSKTMENESLATYSSSLEKNMDDIRGIKHDIKNIFITMGDFVERSGDREMRDYFKEKISPFADDELAKSDMFGKLAAIDNEYLKAVFRYKIVQAMERGIAVGLDIQLGRSLAEVSVGLTDLVRILGILLDNAIEESMTLAQGALDIRLAGNDEMLSFVIMNTVSRERKETGVRAGVSSKDESRGHGLMIARGLLERYDHAVLNSYFKEDYFVQNLVIYQASVILPHER